MLQMAILFQDHMVLQREKPVAVWGTADAGAAVTVTIQGRMAKTTAKEGGVWQVALPPLHTSFAEEMTVVSGMEKIVLRDVQVGEVWLAGGQSNMEFYMRYDADMADEKGICHNDAIRFFDYPEVSYVGQIDEADYRKQYAFWRKAEPEQLERFSAVGYYFAKDLQQKYQIPVGIVGCNWGGTPACAWMSRDAVVAGGGQVYLDEYEQAIRTLDMEEYEANFRANPNAWQVDKLADPIADMIMFGCTMEEMNAKLADIGTDTSNFDPASMLPPMGPKHERRPCGLYESMLKPLVPYTIRGVIWYQGETDGDNHPEVYHTLFPALIRNWRTLWGEELPFLFVQIAPLEQWMDCVGAPYTQVRAAQQHTVDTVPGTGMAVITDVGMQHDIHPKKKQPVGHRLALLAMNKVYGADVLCEAPTLTAVQAGPGKLILTFENAGDGLHLTEKVPHGQQVGCETLGGLQVFQNGQLLDTEQIQAAVGGNQVTLSSLEIRAGVPTEVKLAQSGWYLVNLYNSAGIPARPAQVQVQASYVLVQR